MVEIKRRFFLGIGETPGAYPLGDLFRETRYRAAEWLRFVSSLRIDRDELLRLLLESDGYSGQYSHFSAEALRDVVSGAPAEALPLLAHLWDSLAARDGVELVGAKEISCEEYLPALESRGIEALVVLRDPRDIVASLTTGRSAEYAGKARPLLFTIRHWRKSVAAVLDRRAGRSSVRYEDVVIAPVEALAACLARCGLNADLLEPERLRDARGGTWAGNSSYGDRSGIDASSAGAFERVLSREVARFVEATCLPEMKCLGYSTTLGGDEALDAIRAFVEPYPLERPELGHLRSRVALDEEIERLERLRGAAAGTAEETEWFLSPAAGSALRGAL